MVYLNFTNLDGETQERLLSVSKEDVESRSGTELRQFAKTHDKDYDVQLRPALSGVEGKPCEIYTIMILYSICKPQNTPSKPIHYDGLFLWVHGWFFYL